MTASPAVGAKPGGRDRRGGRGGVSGQPDRPPGSRRPLVISGAMAACAVTVAGFVIVTPFVLVGWIEAPHGGTGLPGVLRTSGLLWLAAHHVGFELRGVGRIGMLPLGLALIPGALLWLAGGWVMRAGGLSRLPEVTWAALALAAPYAAVCGAVALAARTPTASPSAVQAVLAGFLLAVSAGGLGAARTVARWGRLARLLPPRPRSVVLGSAGSLAVLVAGGSVLACSSLAAHLSQFRDLTAELAPGATGGGLLLLAQLAYVPNAVIWAVCYCLGPGFAFGVHTVVAPTGAVLGPMPLVPMLAALPSGASSVPLWAAAVVLALPYAAGVFGGLLTARCGPAVTAEAAPVWGFLGGVVTGGVIGLLAAFSGGPLGSGRLAMVGPSWWQASLLTMLEVGVASAVTAGGCSWLRLHRAGGGVRPAAGFRPPAPRMPGGDDGHRIYVDPWRDAGDGWHDRSQEPPPGPSALP